MNKHKRKALKMGEPRVSGDEIWRLVELSKSDDPVDRIEAADKLCPCHVRRRIDEVWEALYRMLEDPDLRVRKKAFHTLAENHGGNPDDPALSEVYERVMANETNKKILKRVQNKLKQQETEARDRADLAREAEYSAGAHPERGKCDFCGGDGSVKRDYDTPIPDSGGPRPAMVCRRCDT
jgi:hypothetical protein